MKVEVFENLKTKVVEIRMLRWMCDVTGTERIRNKYIRCNLNVTGIARKINDNRLKWLNTFKEQK